MGVKCIEIKIKTITYALKAKMFMQLLHLFVISCIFRNNEYKGLNSKLSSFKIKKKSVLIFNIITTTLKGPQNTVI